MSTLSATQISTISHAISTLYSRFQSGSTTIGIFDSGKGGLSVLPSLTQPQQLSDIYYLGDTAHFPYGEKTEAELIPLVLADIEYLVNKKCALIGIACNTASIVWQTISSQLPEKLQQQAQAVIFDTISTTMVAVKTSRHHHAIGVIGTDFTVKSKAYEKAILETFPSAHPIILQSARQELVNAIEAGDERATKAELDRIKDFFSHSHIDVFILGCTHYGTIVPQLASCLPKSTIIIDPSTLLGQKLRTKVLSSIKVSSPDSIPLAQHIAIAYTD
jgi:glutamate racemase